MSEGVEEVADHVRERTQAGADLVSKVPSLKLVAPAPLHGIVSFTHTRLDPAEVRAELARADINVWTNVANGSPIDGDRRRPGTVGAGVSSRRDHRRGARSAGSGAAPTGLSGSSDRLRRPPVWPGPGGHYTPQP